ncbi:hypothetical protein MKX03_020180 [Papaver bracteatum]|nr:hypothetical protein MKX03_020180 [Papaver bracteatum]
MGQGSRHFFTRWYTFLDPSLVVFSWTLQCLQLLCLTSHKICIQYFPLLLLLEPCYVRNRITNSYKQPQFVSAVMEPLQVDKLMEKMVVELSPCIMYLPREARRIHHFYTIGVCLMQSADVYLIDEPSAYLDSQQCITALKVVKGFIHHGNKSAFGVEHDITMATYLAHRVIVFEGTPSVDCTANAPQTLLSGMNLSLSISEFN